MATIWRFTVPVEDKPWIEMPVGARILSLQMQGNAPTVWALIPQPNAPTETRRFEMYGTGHIIAEADELTHVGTFQMRGGALVFHLFERASK